MHSLGLHAVPVILSRTLLSQLLHVCGWVLLKFLLLLRYIVQFAQVFVRLSELIVPILLHQLQELF